MAMQEGSPANPPSAQVVGNAFVEQYYHILHHSPNLVHRFYQDSSCLSRPDKDGNMTTVTTMQAINEKVLSLNYEDYTAEIKTADAQDSFEKGVIVLVTGCLTGKDNVRKKFTQTFFLAPQDKGYFVLNDVLRYVEEKELHNSVPVNGVSEQASTSALTPEPEPTYDPLVVDPVTHEEVEDISNGAEVCDPSDKEEGSVIEEEVFVPQNVASQNESVATVDSVPVVIEDAPKQSYASIVKVMKSNTASTPVYVPSNNVRAAPADQQSIASAKPAPAPEAAVPNSDNAPESSNDNEEAEGHSIYVRNLPYAAMPAQLEEAFKKFGPIKRNGIQVRTNKGFTFGFVEFEMASSVQSALEASPIIIGDRKADVEEKRTNTRVGSSGRARYSSGKGGFRSDSFRVRGNLGGGRGGYGRNEFRNQGEFSGRPKGSGGRNGDNYQRANHNGRGGRQGGG
ncbi:PREDICTED: ras GTPase-activating protein-binding protein 1 isoform X2 [Theobroma cacao]|uniref:Ras GTPase-activating protein-binding protein 1 isoform X2 n=2 Tax=Theobroma cacao TaxID=3641 RepID=A0AB32VBB5_THECC|nr:PREDICTED: ras GTPase-activating protein-binding protein 1 isoform X2 [Theobroma cacao]EOY22087.1 RNA binding protein, putative isoform 2 [Theobroma cacao]